MNPLRARLIRLAYEKPELREKLLPLLKNAESTVKVISDRDPTQVYLGPLNVVRTELARGKVPRDRIELLFPLFSSPKAPPKLTAKEIALLLRSKAISPAPAEGPKRNPWDSILRNAAARSSSR